MGEDSLSLSELVRLAVLGAAPALLLALGAQVFHARLRGWLRDGQWGQLLLLLLITVALALPLTVLGWVLLPEWFLHLLPSGAGFLGNLFVILALPSAIACAIALYLSRYALRSRRSRPGS